MKEVFPLIFGNALHKNRIADAILENKLPHALLIDGPRGSGKMTFAKQICAALNCENRGNASMPIPCGRCNTCRRIESDSYTDIKILRKASDKATIGVEEIRDFRSDMYLSATESSYKVYIIDDAQAMTDKAQNALLIILEEPPKNVVIMLLASGTDSILTTIKSRTQYIPMSLFTRDEMDRYLCDHSSDAVSLRQRDKDAYDAIIVTSGGVIGNAINLLAPKKREENEEKRRGITAVLSAMKSRASYAELYEAIDALLPSKKENKRQEFTASLELLLTALGDLTVSKKADSFTPIFFTSPSAAREISDDISLSRLMKIYDIISDAHKDCMMNANVNLTAVNMAVKIKMA